MCNNRMSSIGCIVVAYIMIKNVIENGVYFPLWILLYLLVFVFTDYYCILLQRSILCNYCLQCNY